MYICIYIYIYIYIYSCRVVCCVFCCMFSLMVMCVRVDCLLRFAGSLRHTFVAPLVLLCDCHVIVAYMLFVDV